MTRTPFLFKRFSAKVQKMYVLVLGCSCWYWSCWCFCRPRDLQGSGISSPALAIRLCHRICRGIYFYQMDKWKWRGIYFYQIDEWICRGIYFYQIDKSICRGLYFYQIDKFWWEEKQARKAVSWNVGLSLECWIKLQMKCMTYIYPNIAENPESAKQNSQ